MRFRNNLNDFFVPGKISVVMDSSHGSSSKGLTGSFIMKNSNAYKFVVNTFMPQASHTVIEPDGTQYIYKQLSSNAHRHEEFEKMYIGQGAVIDVDVLLEEIKMTGIPTEKLGIAPNCSILQDIDRDFEKGLIHLDGTKKENGELIMKSGSTVSGVGAALIRKRMRLPNVKLAKDVPELQPYICNVREEILARLKSGQSGIGEIAQGWALSYGLEHQYPHTTSRNCSVAAFFDDIMISPAYLGSVCLVQRPFPIRINSNKYISKKEMIETIPYDDLTTVDQAIEAIRKKYNDRLFDLSPEVEKRKIVVYSKENVYLYKSEVDSGLVPYEVKESYSGDHYPDTEETTWEQVAANCGAPHDLTEMTTLTKLPRRVFNFSKLNLKESIEGNMSPHKVFLAVNFCNYVDWEMWESKEGVTEKLENWLIENILPVIKQFDNVELALLGTSPKINHNMMIKDFFQLEN